jgi:transposase
MRATEALPHLQGSLRNANARKGEALYEVIASVLDPAPLGRIATHYDKLARNYPAWVTLAAILLWLGFEDRT